LKPDEIDNTETRVLTSQFGAANRKWINFRLPSRLGDPYNNHMMDKQYAMPPCCRIVDICSIAARASD
jgi:hypothetical protein